ncbi:MAG: transposase family protein [Bdellovibrionales bacterium]|nr:transposase family protein [Bdellovibrionales bacterium]
MILNYDDVKEKPETLRAMTSLNRDEFELLCLSFSQAWEEETQSCQRDPSKGGRKPILTKHEDRLLFILFYLKTYPLQEVLAHLFGMSQGQAHFFNLSIESDFARNAEANGSSSSANFWKK